MMAQFNPFTNTIVSVGVKHVSFWKVVGNALTPTRGVFGKLGTQQTMLCISFDKRFTYTGANDGTIYQWSENNLTKVIPGHAVIFSQSYRH